MPRIPHSKVDVAVLLCLKGPKTTQEPITNPGSSFLAPHPLATYVTKHNVNMSWLKLKEDQKWVRKTGEPVSRPKNEKIEGHPQEAGPPCLDPFGSTEF